MPFLMSKLIAQMMMMCPVCINRRLGALHRFSFCLRLSFSLLISRYVVYIFSQKADGQQESTARPWHTCHIDHHHGYFPQWHQFFNRQFAMQAGRFVPSFLSAVHVRLGDNRNFASQAMGYQYWVQHTEMLPVDCQFCSRYSVDFSPWESMHTSSLAWYGIILLYLLNLANMHTSLLVFILQIAGCQAFKKCLLVCFFLSFFGWQSLVLAICFPDMPVTFVLNSSTHAISGTGIPITIVLLTWAVAGKSLYGHRAL